jgi:hypothetical protein
VTPSCETCKWLNDNSTLWQPYCAKLMRCIFTYGCDGCAYEAKDNGFKALAYRACVERNKEDDNGDIE